MTLVPTPEQQRILDLGPTSVRVRAGAGTGKTTTVAMVIANLVETHGFEPERLLGLTFTNKAAAELAERVGDMLPETVDPARQVEVHTYHGFAAQVLGEFGVLEGVDARAGIITPTFARQLIRDVFHHEPRRHLDMTYMGTLDRIRRLNDQLGDHLLRPPDILDAGAIHVGDELWDERLEMATVLNGYDAAKRELRVVDYADLVTLSVHVLTEHPALATTVRDRYRALILDEYQDTNPAQRVLISKIFGDGFPVIAVGDEDQTIYEWRGASAENFEKFTGHFPTADGSPAYDEELTLNRRSGQTILDVANQVRRRANPGADSLEPAFDIESEISTHWATDALAEAEWIARQFETLHDEGTAWRDMAVLFRKNKDFPIVIDALGRHDIPVEVANVGGLLSVPEISMLRAWLTILQHPEDSAALAQVLFGSTYRLGFADMAALTRWLRQNTPEDEDTEDPRPVSLIEAIERTADVSGLSDDARDRLTHFLDVYTNILGESQGLSLAETCRLVLDGTRAWQDIESLPPNPRLTARLNIYRFLDLADDWSPLAGRPSIAAFLEYLDMMGDEPAEELDSARLSGEDAVTLVTVHRAKGLEWENVAIPGLYHGNFPSSTVGGFPDPERFPHHLPEELRLDTTIDGLPPDEEGRTAFFRARQEIQEWRVAYVAVTRAKKRLFVSGAYWYGLPEVRSTAAKPSELFTLVEQQGTAVDAGHSEPGPRPEVLRTTDQTADPDPLFAAGWQSGLHMSPEEIEELADQAGVTDDYRQIVEDMQSRLFALDEAPDREDEQTPRSVSVTGLVTYAQCPKRFYWTDVDPLPRRRSPAAVRGSEIHRRIELHQRGEVPFDDMKPDLYDAPVDDEADTDREQIGGFEAYEASRFAEDRAVLVEAPFNIQSSNGYLVRGRIDAVYADGGHWEVVDFKSGRRNDDPSRIVQLQAYAVAVKDIDFGLARPDTLDMTFAYLGGGVEVVTTSADDSWVEKARNRIDTLTTNIESEEFDTNPGDWCSQCDFLRFCTDGQAEVSP
ncbi:MAG: ATP-dependent DNA helicase [Acidimicrobiia bacterium]|jgi:DNA helicase-2/ATP-dependent DNA helicase PcrA